MAKNGEKWRKMAKNGDGEFAFFICQIRHFAIGPPRSRDRSKIRLSLIFLKFAGNLDIDSLNRSETSEAENITFCPKYAI